MKNGINWKTVSAILALLVLLQQYLLLTQTGSSMNIYSSSQLFSALPTLGDLKNTSYASSTFPSSHTIDEASVVAGCLIIRDDNFRLPEWLAYHYHVLPLHRVIVALDPRSLESPHQILSQFASELDMNFTIWHDGDYMLKKHINSTSLHQRVRQYRFLQMCMVQLQTEGWKFTALWDTDEFIVSAAEYIKSESKKGVPYSLSQHGLVLRYLQNYSKDCLVMNRILVGAKESFALKNRTLYNRFAMYRFQTLRFRYRNDIFQESLKLNGNGKALINVQKIDPNEAIITPHRPSFGLCIPAHHRWEPNDPFVLNHYVGSWEIYSYRDDYRKGRDRSYESWLYRAMEASKNVDRYTSAWFPGFVDHVGLERAARLLEHSGLDPNYDASHKIDAFKCREGKQCQRLNAKGYDAKKHLRRTKFHHCFWRPHNYRPAEMLKTEFGFEVVDATKTNDWDMIFGGYPHCGKNRKSDPDMKTGLNRKLAKDGWRFLSHQIYFPCMGCEQSFCSKRELCRLQRQFVPHICYLLPDHREELVRVMSNKEKRNLWVLKKSGEHKSNGVSVIDSVEALPTEEITKDSTYLVQPYVEPFVGTGMYQRKTEVRFYTAITSVHPLRVYVFRYPWVSLSQTIYTKNSNISVADEKSICMHDSHTHMSKCTKHGSPLPDDQKTMRMRTYGGKVNLNENEQMSILSQSKRILRQVLNASKAHMQGVMINRNIQEAGASCFSFMRADFGIGEDLRPFLYEINEFPFANEKGEAGKVQTQAYRDLFIMIGIDKVPMVPENRYAYELAHIGNWERLLPLS